VASDPGDSRPIDAKLIWINTDALRSCFYNDVGRIQALVIDPIVFALCPWSASQARGTGCIPATLGLATLWYLASIAGVKLCSTLWWEAQPVRTIRHKRA